MATPYTALPVPLRPQSLWQTPVISATGLYTLRVKHVASIALLALAACAVYLAKVAYDRWTIRQEVRILFASIQEDAAPALSDLEIIERAQRIQRLAHAGLSKTAPGAVNTLKKAAENRQEVRTVFTTVTTAQEINGENDPTLLQNIAHIEELEKAGLTEEENQTLGQLKAAAENRIQVRALFQEIKVANHKLPFSQEKDEEILGKAETIEQLLASNLMIEPAPGQGDWDAQIRSIKASAQERIDRRASVRTAFENAQTLSQEAAEQNTETILTELAEAYRRKFFGLTEHETAGAKALYKAAILLSLERALAAVSTSVNPIPMRMIGAYEKAYHDHLPHLINIQDEQTTYQSFNMFVRTVRGEFSKPAYTRRAETLSAAYNKAFNSAFLRTCSSFFEDTSFDPQKALAFFTSCEELEGFELGSTQAELKDVVATKTAQIKTTFDSLFPEGAPKLEYFDTKARFLEKMQAYAPLLGKGLLPEGFVADLADMQTRFEPAQKEKRCIDLIVGPDQEAAETAVPRDPVALLTAIAELKRELRYESKLIDGVSPAVVAALDLLEKTAQMKLQDRFEFDQFFSLADQFPLGFFEDQIQGRPLAPYIQALYTPFEACINSAYTKTNVPQEWTEEMVDQLNAFYAWADLLPTKGLPSLSLFIEFGHLEETIGVFNTSLSDAQPVILPSMVYRLCAIVKQHLKTSINPLPTDLLTALIVRLKGARGRYSQNQNPDGIISATEKLETILVVATSESQAN